jgi:hypothetical protein
MEQVQYDSYGRMKYHPEYHENHKKGYTVKDLAYICQQYRRGNVKTLALAVGRTEGSLRTLVDKMRQDGTFEFYRSIEL